RRAAGAPAGAAIFVRVMVSRRSFSGGGEVPPDLDRRTSGALGRTICSAAPARWRYVSVFDWMLGAVDDEHFSRAFLRFKLESKLFLEGRIDRWTVGVDRGRFRTVRRPPRYLIRCPRQPHVERAGEAVAIHNRPS